MAVNKLGILFVAVRTIGALLLFGVYSAAPVFWKTLAKPRTRFTIRGEVFGPCGRSLRWPHGATSLRKIATGSFRTSTGSC